MTSPKIPKITRIPRYMEPLRKTINPVVEVFNKGLVVNSASVIATRLRDGRIRLHLAPSFIASLKPPVGPSVTNIVYDAGSGYAAGDILTAVGGTFTIVFTLTIDSVDGSGVPTGWHWAGGYLYTVEPTNPVDFSGGTGTGAQFDLTWSS